MYLFIQVLLKLNLLPLAYDKEIEDLLFFYKVLQCDIDLDVKNNFLSYGRTRLSQKTRQALFSPLTLTVL